MRKSMVKGGAIAGNGFDAGLTGFDVGLLNLALAFFGKRQLVAQTCTALVALGDEHVGAGSKADAKATWERALATPLGKRDMSLLADLEQRISDLEDS